MAERNFKFWANWARAVEWLPDDAAKAAFLLKVMRYAFDGVEPEIEQCEGALWEMVKTALDADMKSQKDGSQGGKRPKRQTSATTCGTPSDTPRETPSETPLETPLVTPLERVPIMNNESETEDESETEGEYNGAREPRRLTVEESERAAEFAKESIDAFNAVTGKSMPFPTGETMLHLRRLFDAGRTVEDVRHVVEAKNRQWGSDPKMKRFVRPSTLFGPKFDEYLNEDAGEVRDGYERYA